MNILEYENYQEIKSFWNSTFPYNTYLCTIPLDFLAVPPHWHNEIELIYIKKGTGLLSVDFTPYTVHSGDLLIILPGQIHSIEQYQCETMEYENIIFKLEMLEAKQNDSCTDNFFTPLLERKLSIPNLLSQDMEHYKEITECIDEIDKICSTFPYGYELAIKGSLYQFFFLLIHYHGTSTINSTRPAQKKSYDKLKLIIKYVENNYSHSISIHEAAALCNFSESHFMKFFKANMNITFTDYLNNYRLSMVARLLLSSNSNISAIAEECGFENLSYFNRMFKMKYRETPSKYRSGN